METDFFLDPQTVPYIETKYRKISTAIPAPGTKEILERLNKVESRSMHGQLPIVWDRAEDFNVYDIAGNKWIDFTSTIFVANVGHSNPRIIKYIQQTLTNPLISCYAYANQKRADYIEKLIEFSEPHLNKAFLLSAGTEATEAVFKLMRMNGRKIGKKHPGVICIKNNWHGRTLGAQMMSSNPLQSEWIGYKDPNIHYLPFPYPWEIKNDDPLKFLDKSIKDLSNNGIDIENDICGFMLETFQGWGALFYPKDYVIEIQRLCEKYSLVLAFDEMQSGFARTGKKFGYQHYDVKPDLIACGKGMGGGVPLSGVIGRAEIMDLPDIGNMSSTHSANPLVCAAGLAVLEEIEIRDLVSEAKRKGDLLMQGLLDIKNEFPKLVSNIYGKGLISAIHFMNSGNCKPGSIFASKVSQRCMQKGLLVVHTGRESIKIGPPLTIPDHALLEGIEVIKKSISEILANDK